MGDTDLRFSGAGALGRRFLGKGLINEKEGTK
jgi:hypothetical protein